MSTIREKKRAFAAMQKPEKQARIYAKREARKSAIKEMLGEWRCFWTWPLGHRYERKVSGTGKTCVICGHPVYSFTSY